MPSLQQSFSKALFLRSLRRQPSLHRALMAALQHSRHFTPSLMTVFADCILSVLKLQQSLRTRPRRQCFFTAVWNGFVTTCPPPIRPPLSWRSSAPGVQERVRHGFTGHVAPGVPATPLDLFTCRHMYCKHGTSVKTEENVNVKVGIYGPALSPKRWKFGWLACRAAEWREKKMLAQLLGTTYPRVTPRPKLFGLAALVRQHILLRLMVCILKAKGPPLTFFYPLTTFYPLNLLTVNPSYRLSLVTL